MALVSLRQVLDHAAEHDYGVPAFNVNNLEQIQAIMEAAQETQSPVILQASAGARKYAGETYLRHMVLAAVEAHPYIPVVLHQDHGASPAVCQQSIRSGFTSVMMDGSLKEDAKTPASYDYNLEVTREVCAQLAGGSQLICGVMLESHLKEGKQNHTSDTPLVYGQSITDACMSWETTEPLLHELADAVRQRRAAR